MSSYIEASIVLKTPQDIAPLLRAFVDVFGTSVLGMSCSRVDAEKAWIHHVLEGRIFNVEDLVSVVMEQGREAIYGGGALVIDVVVDVAIEGYDCLRPDLGVFGPHHEGSHTDQRADVVINFGRRNAYNGRVQLSNGEVLNKQFVMDALAWLAEMVSPASIFLCNDEAVGFPLDYLFVYHHDLVGYVKDLTDIVNLWLYGLASYTDCRHRYAPVSSGVSGDTTMFAGRRGTQLQVTRRFLEVMVPRLVEQGLPTTFDRAFLDVALRGWDENLAYFYTGSGGLGAYGVPPMRFYCDRLYYRLMRALLPGVGNTEWSHLTYGPSIGKRVK